jgi:hypothetical protein
LCGGTGGPSTAATVASRLSFSHYNRPVRIAAPTNAVNATGLKAWTTAAARRSAARTATAHPAPARAGSASARSIQATELVGGWRASGDVIVAHGFSNERPGAVLNRVWRIGRACAARGCRLYFARSTVSAPIVAPLVWAGGHWTADFVQNDACTNGETSVQYSHWTIEVRRGAITALERSRTSGCGPSGGNEVEWRARQVLAAPGSSAHA